MLRKNVFATIFVGAALTTAPMFAQEYSKMDVSVQALGGFVKDTTQNGVKESADNSGGVLASYRYFFTASNGVEVNYGWNRNTLSYDLLQNPFGVKSDQHEFTAAYVYRHHFRGFTPFVEGGVGALVFDPSNSLFNASTQARATYVYGGGADFKLTGRLFMRAEYRGLIYNTPTFGISQAIGTDRYTHRAEPSIGFGYSF